MTRPLIKASEEQEPSRETPETTVYGSTHTMRAEEQVVEHRPRLITSSMAETKSSPSMETTTGRSHTVVKSGLSQPRRRAVQLYLWSSNTQ